MALNQRSPPDDFEHQASGNGLENLEDVGIARAVDHRRAHDHRFRRQRADDPLALQLGFSVVGQRMRLGILLHRRAIRAGADGSQRTDVYQADGPSRQGARQRGGGAGIAGVVIGRRRAPW